MALAQFDALRGSPKAARAAPARSCSTKAARPGRVAPARAAVACHPAQAWKTPRAMDTPLVPHLAPSARW